MIGFILRRLLQAVLVMLTISFASFVIQGKLGDPVTQMVGQNVTLAERAQLTESLGLNDPLLQQYARYLSDALSGDLGVSYYHKQATLAVIGDRLPATLELSFCALLIVLLTATPLGVFAAIRPRHILSRLIVIVSTLGLSVPIFVVAMFLVYFFAVEWQWLPSFGRGETHLLFGFWSSGLVTKDGLQHLLCRKPTFLRKQY